MKNLILVFIFALTITTVFSQDPENNIVVLLPFDIDNISNGHETYLQSQLIENIKKSGHYSIYTRGDDINAMVDEYHFQETGMVKDDERIKIGEMTPATHICVSCFVPTDNEVTVIAKIINIKTGEIEFAVSYKTTRDHTEGACRRIADDLYIKILATNHNYIYTSYNNVNEAINYINERLERHTVSINRKGEVFAQIDNISVYSYSFKISKVTITYRCRTYYSCKIIFSCNNCIKNGYNNKKSSCEIDCKTEKDTQDLVKAFQFIQSQFTK